MKQTGQKLFCNISSSLLYLIMTILPVVYLEIVIALVRPSLATTWGGGENWPGIDFAHARSFSGKSGNSLTFENC